MIVKTMNSLAQSRAIQVVVKSLRLPALLTAALELFRVERKVPGADLKYRLRFADTLWLASSIFSDSEYGLIRDEAASIRNFVDLGCNVGLFTLYLCKLRRDRSVRGILVDGNPRAVSEATK